MEPGPDRLNIGKWVSKSDVPDKVTTWVNERACRGSSGNRAQIESWVARTDFSYAAPGKKNQVFSKTREVVGLRKTY